MFAASVLLIEHEKLQLQEHEKLMSSRLETAESCQTLPSPAGDRVPTRITAPSRALKILSMLSDPALRLPRSQPTSDFPTASSLVVRPPSGLALL